MSNSEELKSDPPVQGPSDVPRRRRRSRRRSHSEAGSTDETGDALSDQPGGKLWAFLLVLVPLTACFLSAGRQTWSLGWATVLMGLAVLAKPPRWRMPWPAYVLPILIALTSLAALLPVSWLGGAPEWRNQVTQEWSLPLPATVTAQPAVTMEAWLVMLCALVWLANALGQRFAEGQRRTALRTLVVGGGVIGALSLLEVWGKLEVPWWPKAEDGWIFSFGPFGNRNHTSSLCAITTVLAAAVAHDAFRRKSWWWIPAGLAFGSSLTAILINTSRGGLLLFFIGMSLWLATAAMQKGVLKKAAVLVSLVFAIGSIAFVSGGNLSQRLRAGLHLDHLAEDYRVLLLEDSMRMSAEVPVAGIGLGNFESVFPQMTSIKFSHVRFLHPESDVLWLLLEGGLLVLVPCIVLVFWLFRQAGPRRSARRSRSRSDHRLRRAATIAVILAVLHACVDAPLHGYAFFTVVALLAGLAIRRPSDSVPSGWGARWTFRLLGLAMIGLGILWLGISRNEWRPPLGSTAHQLLAQATQKFEEGQPAVAMASVDEAIRLTPLNYRLYHLRARIRLQLGQPHEQALRDFGAARAIEPHLAAFCLSEGTYWLRHEPILAVVPWREWIRRSGRAADAFWGGYRQMVTGAAPHPELLAALQQMAVTPNMKLIFLTVAPAGPAWQACLEEILADEAALNAFDADQFTSFLRGWLERGDRLEVVRWLESHPRWQVHGWRVLTDDYARRGDFKAAYEIAAKHQPPIPQPLASSSKPIEALRRAFVLNPTDPVPGVELFYALKARGEMEEAIYALQQVSELPSAPAFLKQEWAALEAQKGDYRRAWELAMAAAGP